MHPIDKELSLMLKGEFDEAYQICEELESLGQEKILDNNNQPHPELWVRHSFNRGWFMLQQGKYQEGSQLLENGRFINVYGNGYLKTAAPIWNPENHSAEGKTIILSLEGGLGDEIIHVRYAKQFKDKGFVKVYVASSPELVSIFKRIDGVDDVIQRDQAHTVAHDYWIPAFSAGWVLGNTFETIDKGNYLSINSTSSEIWDTIIKKDKINIGIRWAGNPKFEHQQFRLFPPKFLTNLNNYPELQLYSFQKDNNTIDLPNDIIDLQHFLISWEDTLAALSKMDLVITSCTSIAHAAAAIGKPTWVIVPILPYHTWAWGAPNSNTSPYYSTVKLYRQKKAKEWEDTFIELYSDLEKKFNLKIVDMPTVTTDKKLKLNLGCGGSKLDNFINIDNEDITEPDLKLDLMNFPWPFEDNSVDHIVAKDILEHLGNTPADFINVLKEMYRVSADGAAWEVQFPHHRCDIAYDDPTHVRRLTHTTFRLFDQKRAMEFKKENKAETPLALIHNIDIEVLDMKHEWVPLWEEKVRNREMTEDQLYFVLNTQSNVAQSVILLIQVYKPGRANIK
jgi:hypothetical protein